MPKVTLTRKKVRGKWSKTYYLSFGRGDLRSTGISDPGLAEQLRVREEAKLVLSSHGMPVPGDFRRTLDSFLKDYEAKLTAPGRNVEYVAQTVTMIRKAARAYKWRTAMQITAADVNAYAVSLREKHSPRTTHSHLTALKGFTRWLWQTGMLPADPLVSVKKPSPLREVDRRMLLHDEWRELRKTTLAEGKEHHGMTAINRVLLYAVAVQTGLRANELRSLTHVNLFLDCPEPFITCRARGQKNGKSRGPKNGKDCKQYIKPDLAADLRANLTNYGAVWPELPGRQYMAPMLREDLAAARAAWVEAAQDAGGRVRREESDFLLAVNHAGEVLDFHALRHTCGAWLALAGCHPKVVQVVMRHSTITLTMDAYGHLFPGQVASAINKLPDMMNV